LRTPPEPKKRQFLWTNLRFPELDWIPGPSDVIDISSGENGRSAPWNWGFNISKGELIDHVEEGITSERHTFELVRDTFRLEKGQKIAVAILFNAASKPNQRTVAGAGENSKKISEQKLVDVYGLPNVVNIYTGKITHVGEQHIEYDVNAFTGCSGAIVFLLDKDQPPSVQSCDHGKAIAVHVGSHPFLPNRNFGFQIRMAADLLEALK